MKASLLLIGGLAVLALGVLALTRLRSDRSGSIRGEHPSRLPGDSTATVELREGATEEPSSTDSSLADGHSLEGPPPQHARLAAPRDDPVQCVLHGTVLDIEGRAIFPEWPYIGLTDAAGERRNTSASEEGHYSLAGLAPGEWKVHIGATGYRDLTSALRLSLDDPILRRDWVLEKAVVLPVYVVTPGGEPLRDALRARGEPTFRSSSILPFPVATLEPPGPTIEEANDAGENQVRAGSYRTGGALADAAGTGVLVLSVDPPVFVSLTVGTRVIATQRVELGTREVTFVLDPDSLLAQECTVRARFVGGEPSAPLLGTLQVEPISTYYNVREGSWSATLPPGRYTLSFQAKGYARIPVEIHLEPGQELDLGEVVLPPEVTIEGRMLDAFDRPVNGLLMLGKREGGVLRFDDTMHYLTDEDGSFRIFGLVPGRYVLRTAGDDEIVFPASEEPPTVWVSSNVPVSTLGGSVTGLDLRLVRAGILVLRDVEKLPAGSRCKILDEHGDLLRWTGFTPGFVPRFALPPGPCTLVLCDEGWKELERRSLSIRDGVTELDLSP